MCTETTYHDMMRVSSSVPLGLSLLFNLLFSSLGLVVFSWASRKLWTSRFTHLFHKNLLWIVQVHLLGFLVHCFGRTVLHALDLYNYRFRRDAPCEMVPHFLRCFVFRLMYNAGMWITTSTAIPLIIERFVATCWKNGYEESGVCLGVLLSFLQPAIAAIPMLLAYSNVDFTQLSDFPMIYCSVYKPGYPELSRTIAITSVVVQFIARFIFGLLFRKNANLRKRKEGDLTTRYQLEENVISMGCLKVYANMSTAFLAVHNVIFGVLIHHSALLEPDIYWALMELDCAFPLYGIVSVAAIGWKFRNIRYKNNHGLNVQRKLPQNRASDAYFVEFKRTIGDGPKQLENGY